MPGRGLTDIYVKLAQRPEEGVGPSKTLDGAGRIYYIVY